MGYDVHITRKAFWADETGPVIEATEWANLVEADPELALDTESECIMTDGRYVFASWRGRPAAFGHYHGEITAKNPDPPLIDKMIEIAKRLEATVQGDDGEHYPPQGDPQPVNPTFLARLTGLFKKAASSSGSASAEANTCYRVGQRFRYLYGGTCTVAAVDPKANHGLGRLTIKLDDGRKLDLALQGNPETLLRPL